MKFKSVILIPQSIFHFANAIGKYKRWIHRSITSFIRREFIALLCKSQSDTTFNTMLRSIMKSWKLDSLQHVQIDYDQNVYFNDYTGNMRREFALSYRHFQCLNHIMKDFKYFYIKKHSRIGNRIWLPLKKQRIQIYHSQLSICFTFA